MAIFETGAIDTLIHDLDLSASKTADMYGDCVDAMGDEFLQEQKQTAGTMLVGQYYKGYIVNGLRKKGKVRMANKSYVDIVPDGTVTDYHHKKGTRVGEIAFINEYGKRGQPARPWMSTANDKALPKAIARAIAVIKKYPIV